MKNDYIIIANGIFQVKEIISEAVAGKTILALDGAANKLSKIGIHPQIILGDFDSIEDHENWGIHSTFAKMQDCTIPYLGQEGVIIVPRKDQQFCDLNKAIHYCDNQGAHSITVICALGGRLDLHEATLRALKSEYKTSRSLLLHNDQNTIRFIKDETIVMTGVIGDKCAILAYPQATLTCSGLQYSVQNYELCLGKADSISNSLISETATVTVTGEALVIMPPQLKSQREYMKHNEVDRLKLRLRDLK